MFFKISVLQNFAIFPGKHLSWSLFLIRLQVFRVFYASRGYRNISGMKWVNDECNRKAVVRRCSVKKVLLEISKNSQENTCASVSLLRKLQAQVFSCEFCEISKEIFSYRTQLAILFKKKLLQRCFPVNFAKFLGTSFL